MSSTLNNNNSNNNNNNNNNKEHTNHYTKLIHIKSTASTISTISSSGCGAHNEMFLDISGHEIFSEDDDINCSMTPLSTPQCTPLSTPPPPPLTTTTTATPSPKEEEKEIIKQQQEEEEKEEEEEEEERSKLYETAHSFNHGDRTLVILDWDDTLHPTSACQSGSKLDIELIRKFCLSVYETLLTMIRLYGSSNIYIVSNADKLWIEKCLNKLSGGYFVNIYHLISLYQIQIISAKNQFSGQFPGDSTFWKEMVLKQLVEKHHTKYVQNENKLITKNKNENENNNDNDNDGDRNKQFCVVSIGDSHHEYIASKRVINRLNKNIKNNKKIILHRIKLLQNPTLKQLIQQYSLIKNISYLFKSEINEINIDYAKEMNKFFHFKKQPPAHSNNKFKKK